MRRIGILAGHTATKSPLMDQCDFIHYYSLIARVGDQEFSHGDITLQQYFDLIVETNEIPKTSQPSTSELKQHILDACDKYEHVFMVCMSSSLSGTYQAACIIVDELGLQDRVTVLDAESTTLSESILIDTIIKGDAQNRSIQEIKEALDRINASCKTYLFPTDFKYLRHSGRISGVQSFLGAMLNMRVFVEVDKENGNVNVVGKGRGVASILKFLNKQIEEKNYRSGYYSNILLDKAQYSQIVDFLKTQNLDLVECYADDVVPATHFGPNTFGICFYNEEF